MSTARPSREIMPLDSLDGPALPLSAAEVDRLAHAIGRRAGSAGGTARSGRRRGRLAELRWRVGFGVAVVTGTAAALHWIPGPAANPPSKAPAMNRQAASVPASGPRLAKGPVRVPAEAASADEAKPVSSAGSLDAGRSRAASSSRSVSPEPARLLARANELRRNQQWASATALYERIVRQFPVSAEAYSASVAAASLRLEKLGDPAAGRRLYELALRSGRGALDEEILWGLARADRAAGDLRAERATLERLVAAHPRSLHAPYARARLRELSVESR